MLASKVIKYSVISVYFNLADFPINLLVKSVCPRVGEMFNYSLLLRLLMRRVYRCSDSPLTNVACPISLILAKVYLCASHILLDKFWLNNGLGLLRCNENSALPDAYILQGLQLSMHLYHILLIHEWQAIHSSPLCTLYICSYLPFKRVSFALYCLRWRWVVGIRLKILMRKGILLAFKMSPFIRWESVLLKIIMLRSIYSSSEACEGLPKVSRLPFLFISLQLILRSYLLLVDFLINFSLFILEGWSNICICFVIVIIFLIFFSNLVFSSFIAALIIRLLLHILGLVPVLELILVSLLLLLLLLFYRKTLSASKSFNGLPLLRALGFWACHLTRSIVILPNYESLPGILVYYRDVVSTILHGLQVFIGR